MTYSAEKRIFKTFGRNFFGEKRIILLRLLPALKADEEKRKKEVCQILSAKKEGRSGGILLVCGLLTRPVTSMKFWNIRRGFFSLPFFFCSFGTDATIALGSQRKKEWCHLTLSTYVVISSRELQVHNCWKYPKLKIKFQFFLLFEYFDSSFFYVISRKRKKNRKCVFVHLVSISRKYPTKNFTILEPRNPSGDMKLVYLRIMRLKNCQRDGRVAFVTFKSSLSSLGQRPGGEGCQRPERPLRPRDPPPRQEASTRDQDQTADTQPKVEWNVLLRR